MGSRGGFGVADFAVFGFTLLVSLFIGLYFAIVDRKKQTENYMYGNRKMPAIAVALSMAMTFQSALGIISFPAEMYLYGVVNAWGIAGYMAGVALTAHYYIPFYRNLNINSVYEYLEIRFNRTLRLCTSVIVSAQFILFMGICVYLPALTLNAVTPLSLSWSIFGTSVVCTLYTAMGGLKAVIWTDVLQGTILIVGNLAIAIQLLIKVGGFGEMWAACGRGGRLNFFESGLDPRIHASLPIVFVGNFVFSMQSLATSQPMVQRYISCKDVKSSQRSLYINGLVMCASFIFYVFIGLEMYAYYEGCDPVMNKQIHKADQAIPFLVVEIFKGIPGMAGLFISAVYSASLSTVSSGVNSIASNILHDFVLLMRPNLSKRSIMRINRVSSLLLGILVTIVSFTLVHTHGTILQLAFVLYGSILGPNLAVFLFAFIPFINNKGAVSAVICGVIVGVWLAVGKQIYPVDPSIDKMLPVTIDACAGNFSQIMNATQTTMLTTETIQKPVLVDTFYAISPFLIGFVGAVATIFVGVVVSLATGGTDRSKFNPDFFIPLVSGKPFPPSVVKFFRFGVPEKHEYKLQSVGDFKDIELDKLSQSI